LLDPALALLIRSALALLLGAGAIGKVRDRATFRAAVDGYDLLPARAVGLAAWLFPIAEGGLALALVAPGSFGVRSAALAGAALLFAVYGVAIAINLARGRREIDCGCGGAAHVPLSGWLVARNALLVAAALAATGGTSARALGLVDALTVAGGVAVLALLWSALHGLLAYAGELTRMQEDV
jgi:Methylamine utilisation protein MauE